MAIYHLSSQIIGRSGGKSSVASAAYRSGEKIQDEHIGQTFDYTKKMGVDYKEILAPDRSPAWVQDRAQLWNQVELIERRKDAQLARELNIALPKELSKEQQIELIRNFSKEQFVDKGMVADLTMHHLNGENPHAHIMLTTREIGPEGFGKKNREWNDRELLKDWRKEWAEQTNRALEKAGVLERVDHRSLKDQGERNRLPQKHIGVHASAMEKKGIQTERGDYNRAVLEINAEIQQYKSIKRGLIQEEKQANHERDIVARNKAHELPTAPIHDQTQPISAQQPSSAQPEMEISFSQVKRELGKQEEVIHRIDGRLRTEGDNLRRYKDYDRQIGEAEARLGNLSRFKPWQWDDIKTWEKTKARVIGLKQDDFGETKRDDIEQRINKLTSEKRVQENKLPELKNRYDRAKADFDEYSMGIKASSRQKDFSKSKDLLERHNAGEKLTTQETRLINSFSKELNIKKIPIKGMSTVIER